MKGFFKTFENSQENSCTGVFFLINLQASMTRIFCYKERI